MKGQQPIDLVLSKLPGAKRSGKEWTTKCPAHHDNDPSLHIRVGDDGRVLLHCFSTAKCTEKEICKAIGIGVKDLFVPRSGAPAGAVPAKPAATRGATYLTRQDAIQAVVKQTSGRFVIEYCYRDLHGNEVFWVVRLQTPSGKTFRPLYRDEAGWRLSDPPGLLPLYRLPEIHGHNRVHICEGEKAAGAAAEIGMAATASAHGSQSAKKSDWTPLAGKEVVVWPDNDEPGQAYADSVIEILNQVSPRPRIKIIDLPGLPPHGDMADFVALRRAAGKSDEEIHAEVERLADQAQPLELATSPATALVYEAFPLDVLPEGFRGYVDAAAHAIGCDPAMIAVPALAGAAAAIGNTRRIRIKASWAEPAVLWAAIVASSGMVKSPALEAALAPVYELQAEAVQRYEQQARDYAQRLEAYEAAHAEWEQTKEGPEPSRPIPPEQPRYVCSDVTVEALATLLQENPRGLLLVRDELAGWIRSFDRYAQGKGGEAAYWLEMFGARPLMVDRKTGEPRTIIVDRAAVCVTGTIQPGALARALGKEHVENGLAARILFVAPPRRLKRWTDADVPAELRQRYKAIFEQLYALEPHNGESGGCTPVDLPLSEAARALFVKFYDDHSQEQADLPSELDAAWSKLEAYAARLALVLHCIRQAEGDPMLQDPLVVNEASMRNAIQLVEWFKTQTRRSYGMLHEDEQQQAKRDLVELIERKGGRITVRDLRLNTRRFPTPEDAERTLDDLAKDGIGDWEAREPGSRGGRPTRTFALASAFKTSKPPTCPRERETPCSVGIATDRGAGDSDSAEEGASDEDPDTHDGPIAMARAPPEGLADCEVVNHRAALMAAGCR